MYKKLLESDLVEADFSRIFECTTLTEATPNKGAHEEVKPANYNWSKDLKDRLEANKQLSPNARKSQYELETEFFIEFFNWLFKDEELTKCAMRIGGELQKDLKVFGFSKKKNPILAFLCVRHVQTNILRQGLLNASTYKAIHKAVVNNLIADSEFFKVNDYNIIYCADLYKKSLDEIYKYIDIQSNILESSASSYTATDLENNRRAFFYIKKIKEPNIIKRIAEVKEVSTNELQSAHKVGTTLNSTEFASKFTHYRYNSTNTTQTTNIEAIANKICSANSPAAAFAVIQHLCMINKLPEAEEALSGAVFSPLTQKEIATATIKVSPLLAKLKLSEKEAKTLVAAILNGIQ